MSHPGFKAITRNCGRVVLLLSHRKFLRSYDVLTVEEAAAIQTFPRGMTWCGPRSAQFRQIGNAVPPRLALAAAKAIDAALNR